MKAQKKFQDFSKESNLFLFYTVLRLIKLDLILNSDLSEPTYHIKKSIPVYISISGRIDKTHEQTSKSQRELN